jgi:hypothetical protein
MRDGLSHDQLQSGLDRHLGVVALHGSIRPFHDARLWIRKVVLGLRRRLRFLAVFPFALSLLAGPFPRPSRLPVFAQFCFLADSVLDKEGRLPRGYVHSAGMLIGVFGCRVVGSQGCDGNATPSVRVTLISTLAAEVCERGCP